MKYRQPIGQDEDKEKDFESGYQKRRKIEADESK